MRKLLSFAALALLPFSLIAGSITLRDGRVIQGRFVAGSPGQITFQDDNGQQYRFNTTEVRVINFAGTSDSAGYNNTPAFGARNNSGVSRAGAAHIIPAGAELAVRTNQVIDSHSAGEGQAYSANVERDIMDENGNIAIPRGSEAQLVIRDARGGKMSGSNNLILDVESVTINGQRYLVNTEDLQRTGKDGVGTNRRTAEYVGGGTALGTLLGAIGGGGKGALIGAIAGAAAGTGVEVLTKGGQVKVPAETILTFRLDQPLNLRPANR